MTVILSNIVLSNILLNYVYFRYVKITYLIIRKFCSFGVLSFKFTRNVFLSETNVT